MLGRIGERRRSGGSIVTKGSHGESVLRRCAPLGLALGLVVAGCTISPEKRADTVNAINRAFQAEYESILKEKGTRVFRGVSRDAAFVGMRAAMLKLGMQITDEDPALGYLNVRASAPKPLDLEEWRQAADADLPKARKIIADHLNPFVATLFTFEPQGLDIVMNVTIIEVREGAEVSLTMRMREIAPPKGDLPRREYPPPTAVRMGLDKIWRQFDQELRAGTGRR